MVEAAALILFAYGVGLFGICFGVAVLFRGRVRLTRHRELIGGSARWAGLGCVVVSAGYLTWVVGMLRLYDG
jgi:hypothetical protein